MTPNSTQQPPQPKVTAQPQTFQNGFYAQQGNQGAQGVGTPTNLQSTAPANGLSGTNLYAPATNQNPVQRGPQTPAPASQGFGAIGTPPATTSATPTSTPTANSSPPGVQTFNNGFYSTWGQPNGGQAPTATQPTNTTPTTSTTTTPSQTLPTGVNQNGQIANVPTAPLGQVQTNVNTSNVPSLVGGDALSQQMTDAQQAAYKQATAYLDPQFANQENALRNQLVNQGIPQNSEAWNKAMDDFQRNKQFAYQQAQQAAVQQGNAAQAQLFGEGLTANQTQFGQNLSSGNFANSAQQQQVQQILEALGFNEGVNQNNFTNSLAARQQDINELLLQQQNPLQMYQALTQGTNVSTPNFAATPGTSVGGTDIASIIANALGQQNNVYNAQVGSQNSNTAAYASIIAALLSDRRLKTNIRMIGKHEIGVPIYTFDYIWGEPGIGVMADEIEKVMPHAVFDVCGFKAVNYAEFSKVA